MNKEIPASVAANVHSQAWGDRLFQWTTLFFAVFVLAVLAAILLTLAWSAWPAFEHFGWHFLVSSEWNPVTLQFGALTPMVGTLVTSLIAMLIGIPISFGIALFITEMSPSWLKRPVGTAIELLAAIPSIIYGMWGLFVFAPFFTDHIQPLMTDTFGALPLIGPMFQGLPIGISVFNAGFILAIMVIPFIAAIMRDVFEVVPRTLKESAYAMGSTRWEVVWRVVLPYTKVGVIGGIMLGLGRALGETMAVTFVIGNAHDLHLSLFMPGSTISSTLANEFTEADGKLYTSSLIALGFLLFVITVIVLSFARLLLMRLERTQGGQKA
ncbi:phosphate ABC transporter permease subunit PstC [Acidihalobacter yilgarnensis]|uniref:phosphate ABC transporter permease subunit PstC n=1 Tax=Acidihalobacter yilgarnensis TaxID=2819280 RepID=UPI001E5D20FD|nr:phosphate ABC transporter permease subunit PstC [Acidihalobacter yilgarnensis]